MGLLSYFGKQTYTLYIQNRSGYFVDDNDKELWCRLNYQAMYMHENRYKGYGVDYDNLPLLLDPPIRKVISTSSDLLALRQIADKFNEEQATDLYYRVSRKIRKGNLSDSDSDHPFPIRFKFNNNVLGYPEDYGECKWDAWYSSGY